MNFGACYGCSPVVAPSVGDSSRVTYIPLYSRHVSDPSQSKRHFCAFKELDSNLGERVLAETGLNPASLVQDERKEDTSEGEKAFQQFRKEVAAFEATNRDYIIDLTNWRLVELEEN